MADWNPTQYERFAAERRAPFDDLVSLLAPRPGARVVDLGCGTGELTRALHEATSASSTLGIDSSAAMLEKATAESGLAFVRGDIVDAPRDHAGPYDVVFSNAALQWLPDLAAAVRAIAPLVADGGQIAVQVPQNFDHPSHVLAADVAEEAPFSGLLDGYARRPPLTRPEAMAELLFALGFTRQRVRVEVYAHLLPTTRDVVEWVKGTLLVDYEKRLPKDAYAAFLGRYTARLVAALGERAPYLYPFKRMLLWGQRG